MYLNRWSLEQSWIWLSASWIDRQLKGPGITLTDQDVITVSLKVCFSAGLTFILYGIHVTVWWWWWKFLQETKRKNFLPVTPNDAQRCLAFFSSQCICESDNVIIPVHRDYNLKVYSLPNYRQPVRRYQGVCAFVWITSVISSKYIYWKWEKKYSSLPACHHSWTENGHTTQISF